MRDVRVFVSYSHRDAQYLADDSLLGFLKGLSGEGVELWTDERIAAGAPWDQEIEQRLRSTDIALVLVSQSFLDSPYCTKIEISSFLERCRSDGMVLLPVVLSPCEWERHGWLASRQFLPGGNETIEEHYADLGRRKRLFLRIRQELRGAIDGVRRSWKEEAEAPAADAPRPRVAERRRFTVLRCALLPAELDGEALDAGDLPEVLHELMPEIHRLCAEVVGHFDGHLARRLVNGALAYFGYPAAHEDDSRRAVRAALELCAGVRRLSVRSEQEMQVRLSLRAGIHTGQAVALDAGADADSEEQLAQGETPAAAEYLHSLAPADSVVVSEATHRLIAGFFDTEGLAAVRLPGSASAQGVFQVLRDSGAQTRFQVELRKGLTPLVGRAEEIALALDRWAEARAGRGQLVMLCAEAGIGKSRLLEEIRTRVSEDPHHWIECLCSPYHQNSALYPIATRLAAWMRLDREGSNEERLRQIESHLREFDVAREHVPLIAALLAIPYEEHYPPIELEARERRRITFEITAGMVIERALDKPSVLVVEDVHWADPSTLEWLGLLLEQVPACPLLVLLAFRPEFAPPADWLQRSHASHLTLGRLDRDQVGEMIARITGGKALPAEVAAEVLQKTEGLPLFVEDLTRMVLESGLVEERDGAYVLSGPFQPLAIPDNLQEALMARLERLATARPVAQLGAAIGREFSYEMLREVAELDDEGLARELDRLVAAGLLYRRGLLRRARYVWKHALIQEALLQSLVKRQRRQVHKRIAEALEKRFPETAETQPELVAYHLTEAGRSAEAVGYWLRAAQRAAGASAYLEAIRHARRGLDLIRELPEGGERDRRELLLEAAQGPALSALKGWGSPESGACCNRALALCRQIGSPAELSPIQYGLALNLIVRGRLREALEVAKELLATAEAARDDGIFLAASDALCCTYFCLGDLSAACEQARRAMAIYYLDKHHAPLSRLYGQDPAAGCLHWSCQGLWQLGYPDQSLAVARETMRLAGAFDHRFSRVLMLFSAAGHFLRMRDDREADTWSAQTIAAAHDYPAVHAIAGMVRGSAIAVQGRDDEGIAMMKSAMDANHARGGGINFCEFHCLLAEAYVRAGRHDEAQSLVDRALETAAGHEDRNHWSELHRLEGDLRHLAGAPAAEVEDWLERSRQIARQQGARTFELRTAMSLARLHADRGKREEARCLLAEVYGTFTEGFSTPDLVDARELLKALS
ncbi:MAG TPA: AAA family ATPase [Thermoanaerobaculia bacterium]|nr:AAA family ATPase [Thermoanaerobaculia bacterium]